MKWTTLTNRTRYSLENEQINKGNKMTTEEHKKAVEQRRIWTFSKKCTSEQRRN